jgi:hypothetical protein
MSVAVLIGVHDGVVLAADSASTLSLPLPLLPPGVVLPTGAPGIVGNVYDNANKIFNILKGQPIGCITFGSGNIGNASIATLIKDLRKKLTDAPEEMGFDVEKYTMKDIAETLAKFLAAECDKVEKSVKAGTNVGFLLGGYSKPGDLGEAWSVEIIQGIAQPPKQLRKPDEAGISWGGQTEILQRMIIGASPGIFSVLGEVSQPKQSPADIANKLLPLITARLQAPIVFAPMPIQDAIDLARFLVHAAIMFSRFSPGPNVVGGPIEIAAITKHENFKWISRKHYYDGSLNKEPVHVVLDK